MKMSPHRSYRKTSFVERQMNEGLEGQEERGPRNGRHEAQKQDGWGKGTEKTESKGKEVVNE